MLNLNQRRARRQIPAKECLMRFIAAGLEAFQSVCEETRSDVTQTMEHLFPNQPQSKTPNMRRSQS